MKLHPRESIVRKAGSDLLGALIEIREKHELTDGEYLAMLSETFGNSISHLAKYMIRYERHEDYQKEGGLAYDEED